MKNGKPHIYILPEDRADEQIAIAFRDDTFPNERFIHVERIAGGWLKVIKKFENEFIAEMRNDLYRRVILLLDFDEQNDRRQYVQDRIPDDLKGRVYIIGVWSNPEALRTSLGMKFEAIGEALSQDCRNGAKTIWDHELLKHNANEVERMIVTLRPILFP